MTWHFRNFWGPVRIFSKIRDYIRKQRLITGVNDTDDKWKNFWGMNLFHILLSCCWVAIYTHIMIFSLMFTLSCRQADFVASVLSQVDTPAIIQYIASVVDIVNILSLVSTTSAINTRMWIFSRIFVKIWNGPNRILRGETDSWKKPKVKNLVSRLPTKMFCAQGSHAAFRTIFRVTDCYMLKAGTTLPKGRYWKDFHFQ